MKARTHQLIWAVFLLSAGVFLVLKNLGVFRDLGDAIWGGLFALMGLGFLAWFLMDRQRHWRVIAGFPLLASGAVILLAWRGIGLGDWQAAVVLFGVALGFWTVLLTHDDNWWALIPAGVLTLLAALSGFHGRLDNAAWLALFLLGLGLIFGLFYLLRLGQSDAGWAGIPAAAFFLIGLVSLMAALKLNGLAAQWWPALLVVGGAALLVLAVGRPGPPSLADSAPSVATPSVLAADQPAVAEAAAPSAPEKPVDIYALLAEQPQDDASAGSQQPADS